MKILLPSPPTKQISQFTEKRFAGSRNMFVTISDTFGMLKGDFVELTERPATILLTPRNNVSTGNRA